MPLVNRYYQGEKIIEFAEEYSKKDRIKRLILALLIGAVIFITHEVWVFPFITWYANTAHCHHPLGYSGVSVLWYALFVGLPLLIAFLLSIFLLPLAIKGLIHGQFPPKGIKVYKPTKIMIGWKASVKSYCCLFVPCCFIIIAIWGYFQVEKMPAQDPAKINYSLCKDIKMVIQ